MTNTLNRNRGYLPHFDSAGAIQSLTFRLADSLPATVVAELRSRPDTADLHAEIELALDAGRGSCTLGRPEAAAVVAAALRHFDGQRYRLLAWCVMPNHVHVVIALLGATKLSDVVFAWKSFTAKRLNAMYGTSGRFWQPDYFDRMIRDEVHLAAAIAYVEENPVSAGLAARPGDWRASSAFDGG